MSRPQAIVTDIEGTTTPIAFVRDTLFPFARANIAGYVERHGGDGAVARALSAARAEMGGAAADTGAAIATLIGWIDADRKSEPLKTLQGMIWRDGYESGVLAAPVYDDAAVALARWRAAGIALAVYSSGSVAAQKLLFSHTNHGDLAGLFAHWFDLATGSKLEADSYRRIAGTLDLPGADILFLSDHPGELDAAKAAGLRALRVDRGDPPPAPPGAHPTVRSFAEIDLDAA